MMGNEGTLRKVLALFLFVVGALAGYQLSILILSLIPAEIVAMTNTAFLIPYKRFAFTVIGVIVCGFVGVMLTPVLLRMFDSMSTVFDKAASGASWNEIMSSLTGFIIGLIVANLFSLPFWILPFGAYIAILLNVSFGFVGARIFVRQQRKQKHPINTIMGGSNEEYSVSDLGLRKILDSSVAIDARILDIAKTGFLTGTFVIPQLVLLELQSIADSTDPMRRARGRRGLDTVNGLQQLTDILKVEIAQDTLHELNVSTVDSALIELAKRLDAVVLTTDYNLSKLSKIQDVRVLNVNDLANAVRPLLMPGDVVIIDVIREGKELNQGVGYLDDGTMLVVEDGETWIGKRIEVVVTSMLQTSAGRMVFGRARKEVRT